MTGHRYDRHLGHDRRFPRDALRHETLPANSARPMVSTFPVCCPRAASGHAATAPPSAASNSPPSMVTVIRPSRARVRKCNDSTPRVCSLRAQGRAGWLALSGSCAARSFPAAATSPPPAISDDSATAAATDISSAIVPRLYFRPGREGAGAAIWEVHALDSALGLGPKARMGEKPCGIVQAGDRHNSADLRRASRFGHFDDLDPAAWSQTRHVGVHQ